YSYTTLFRSNKRNYTEWFVKSKDYVTVNGTAGCQQQLNGRSLYLYFSYLPALGILVRFLTFMPFMLWTRITCPLLKHKFIFSSFYSWERQEHFSVDH